MIKYKQVIREGMNGRDVLAVKLGMRAMHAPDGGSLIIRGAQKKHAGHSFTKCVMWVQKNHNMHQDGIYGPKTHEIVAPHFSLYAKWLYRTSTKRVHKHPPVPSTAVAAAKRLVELHNAGKLRDDNGRTFAQIVATAAGKGVWSPMGRYVHLNPKTLEALCYLIDVKGHKLGLYAICSDHPYDSPLGHAGGDAVDVSSIDGITVNSSSVGPHLHKALKDLHAAGHLVPWQLISGGFAYHADSECLSLTIPSAGFYGSVTMHEHENHMHVGHTR
jgi:hypothetical protein